MEKHGVCLGTAGVQESRGHKDWGLFLTERFLKVGRLGQLVSRDRDLENGSRALGGSHGST